MPTPQEFKNFSHLIANKFRISHTWHFDNNSTSLSFPALGFSVSLDISTLSSISYQFVLHNRIIAAWTTNIIFD